MPKGKLVLIMGKFFIECIEANHVCDKSQYKEASFWEKLKLNFHLLYCKYCREYTKNNQKLTKTVKKANVVCMDENTKKKMEKTVQKELAEQQH